MAAQTHPPIIVYAMLVVMMLASSLLAGHRMAAGKRRSWIHMVGFALTMAFALYVIVDLEFPRLGLIRVDAYDQLLVDVRGSMR
jgi:hypothetical protein